MKKTLWLAGAGLLVLGAAAPASAQSAGWTAWQGCWAPAGEDAVGEVVCMVPGEQPAAMRVITVRDGAVADETVIRADGIARPVTEGGCTGTERADFSADGRRVFTRAELDCDGVRRISTGVLAVLTEVEWVEAQSVGVGDQYAVRTTRYRAAATPALVVAAVPADRQMAIEAARLYAAAPLEVDQVAEAAHMTSPPTVEALLATRQQGFGLDGSRLLALRDAGVPQSTIDVMIALSYPERFAVEERATEERPELQPLLRDPRYGSQACYDRGYSRFGYADRFINEFGRCDYRRSYGYSPWGYDSYGWNYHDRNTPVVVIVNPGEPGEGQAPASGGRVVKGRGYRATGAATGETAIPRATPTRVTDRGEATTSSSKPATVRSSGSSGSSGSSTGRTAKPRGGN